MMRTYMGRKIPPILQCDEHSFHWLSREERWLDERPELLINVLSIRHGMKVADVGAGTGFMTIPLAKKVGRHGFVIATDLQPAMLDQIHNRHDLPDNVYTILSTAYQSGLTANTFDLILLVDVYHEAPRPDLLLKDLKSALKSTGRLVLVEYRKEDPRVPIHKDHKMTSVQIQRELHANGFRLIQQFEHLPWQHLLIFQKAR